MKDLCLETIRIIRMMQEVELVAVVDMALVNMDVAEEEVDVIVVHVVVEEVVVVVDVVVRVVDVVTVVMILEYGLLHCQMWCITVYKTSTVKPPIADSPRSGLLLYNGQNVRLRMDSLYIIQDCNL